MPAAHRGCSVPSLGEQQHRKMWPGFLCKSPRGSLSEAGRSSALIAAKITAGESEREGDRPPSTEDAHTSVKLGVRWGGCCLFCSSGGFSSS